MDFCDRDTVRKAIEGKFVCLVGSGPGLLQNPREFVDSHDVVIRVNTYMLTGPVTGRRCDIHYSFYGSSVRKTAAELKRDGVQLCMAKCPNAQFIESVWHKKNNKMRGVDFSYIYEARKNFWFCPTYVPTTEEFLAHFNLLGGHVPTTGFSALLDVLSYNPKNVMLTGYDFFQSRIHNLFETWGPSNTDDPIGHVPDAERAWFAANMANLPVKMDQTMTAALSNNVLPQTKKSSRVFRRRRIVAA